jgi:hypothetical protein
MEAGKTCVVTLPEQALGEEDESVEEEGGAVESTDEVDATDVEGNSENCPAALESGKEPTARNRVQLHVSIALIGFEMTLTF